MSVNQTNARLGHDSIRVTSVNLSADNTMLTLHLASMTPADQIHLRYEIESGSGIAMKQDLFLTNGHLR